MKVPPDRRHHLKALRTAISSVSAVVKLEEFTDSVGVVAHLFKRFLQSLPEPLMTFKLYDSFVLAACAIFCFCFVRVFSDVVVVRSCCVCEMCFRRSNRQRGSEARSAASIGQHVAKGFQAHGANHVDVPLECVESAREKWRHIETTR
jgi:hypothetical protein